MVGESRHVKAGVVGEGGGHREAAVAASRKQARLLHCPACAHVSWSVGVWFASVDLLVWAKHTRLDNALSRFHRRVGRCWPIMAAEGRAPTRGVPLGSRDGLLQLASFSRFGSVCLFLWSNRRILRLKVGVGACRISMKFVPVFFVACGVTIGLRNRDMANCRLSRRWEGSTNQKENPNNYSIILQLGRS